MKRDCSYELIPDSDDDQTVQVFKIKINTEVSCITELKMVKPSKEILISEKFHETIHFNIVVLSFIINDIGLA